MLASLKLAALVFAARKLVNPFSGCRNPSTPLSHPIPQKAA
nr:hypothetical protein [uncultured Kingella sp.]